MNILEHIVNYKKEEVSKQQDIVPVEWLKLYPNYKKQTPSLRHALETSPNGIIGEFKQKSPSKGILNVFQTPIIEVINHYAQHNIPAISVLTDFPSFGGNITDLAIATSVTNIPILRKEFIIDPYQIHEAKAFGASAILLIASVLSQSQVESLSSLAKSLGLEVLLEIHNKEEIKHICKDIDMVGVNNRNLSTFETKIEVSLNLSNLIPNNVLKVSESGIDSIEAISALKAAGFKGFLMGEVFMKNIKNKSIIESFTITT